MTLEDLTALVLWDLVKILYPRLSEVESLIEKIGLVQVEWLEGPHELNRYRREDLIEIRKVYTAKHKELSTQ